MLNSISPWGQLDRDREYLKEFRDPYDFREPREPNDWRKHPESELNRNAPAFNPLHAQAHFREIKDHYEHSVKIQQQ